MEVDPLIQKALQHLISRKPDSTEKLKQMLFESLGREYVPPKKEPKLQAQISQSHDSVESMDDDDAIDMGAETDCSTDVGGGRNEDTMDADDFAFDMGISCVICRQFDVSSNNQLLECEQCHSLYHQLCHKPVVSESPDVWHCYKCSAASEKVKSTKTEENSSTSKKSEAFKKPDSKESKGDKVVSKKSADATKDKDKKLKSGKKEKTAEKSKGSEKARKHKTPEKDIKQELSSSRKDKSSSAASKAAEASSKHAKSSGAKDKTTGEQKSDKLKQSSSEQKHKHSTDKEKKVKKSKKEKIDS